MKPSLIKHLTKNKTKMPATSYFSWNYFSCESCIISTAANSSLKPMNNSSISQTAANFQFAFPLPHLGVAALVLQRYNNSGYMD